MFFNIQGKSELLSIVLSGKKIVPAMDSGERSDCVNLSRILGQIDR
jgi:hypothetical protein